MNDSWINVDNRLPEDDGFYLVCIDTANGIFQYVSYFYVDVYGFDMTSSDLVTHWQPLPHPPLAK